MDVEERYDAMMTYFHYNAQLMRFAYFKAMVIEIKAEALQEAVDNGEYVHIDDVARVYQESR